MKARHILAIAAAAVGWFGMTIVGPGVWATFTSTGAISQKITAGTVSLTAVACQRASDDDHYVRDGGGGILNLCDGGPWKPCSLSGVVPATTSAGFFGTAAVEIDDLGDLPSDLPSSVPVLVKNAGSLPLTSMKVSLVTTPVALRDTSLLATVLWDGKVAVASEPLSTLITTPASLLASGNHLKPGATGLVQIDLDKPAHAAGGVGPDKSFDLTVMLTGSSV